MRTTTPVGLLLVLLAGCGGGSGSGGSAAPDVIAPRVVGGPLLAPNPNAKVPLAAVVELATDEPSRATIAIDDGVHPRAVHAETAYRTDHVIQVLGLRPGLTHSIEIVLEDASGNATALAPLAFDAPPLPPDFPPLELLECDPARMEPGVTLFAARYQTPGGGPRGNFVVLLDAAGEVVWYYRDPFRNPTNVEVLRNGDLLCLSNNTAFEIDRLGNDVAAWHSAGYSAADAPAGAVLVDTDCFHHELYELPEEDDADFIALSKEIRVLPGYPADELDPLVTSPTARVAGDVIVEFRRDGTIVRETKLLDVLDPYRIGYGALEHFWKCSYPVPTHDWGHANSVIVDRADDAYIVSLRHQDCVAKIGRTSGQLVWILGPHEGWGAAWRSYLLAPAGAPFEWSYHQHAPRVNALGHLVLFDNGNYRATPPAAFAPAGEWYSRAVEYAIDPAAMTVSQVWSYGGPGGTPGGGWFSGSLCEADPLPATGNVLVTDGAKPATDAKPSPGVEQTYARIAEVTRTEPPEVVFEVRIGDPAALQSWSVYRSQRVPDVYPEPGPAGRRP